MVHIKPLCAHLCLHLSHCCKWTECPLMWERAQLLKRCCECRSAHSCSHMTCTCKPSIILCRLAADFSEQPTAIDPDLLTKLSCKSCMPATILSMLCPAAERDVPMNLPGEYFHHAVPGAAEATAQSLHDFSQTSRVSHAIPGLPQLLEP